MRNATERINSNKRWESYQQRMDFNVFFRIFLKIHWEFLSFVFAGKRPDVFPLPIRTLRLSRFCGGGEGKSRRRRDAEDGSDRPLAGPRHRPCGIGKIGSKSLRFLHEPGCRVMEEELDTDAGRNG
jgi:hypothetical protein